MSGALSRGQMTALFLILASQFLLRASQQGRGLMSLTRPILDPINERCQAHCQGRKCEMEKEQEPFTVLLEKIYVRKEEEIKKRQLGTRAILFFSAVIPVFVFCYLEKLSPYIVVVWLVAMQVIVIHGIPNSFVAKIRKKLRI